MCCKPPACTAPTPVCCGPTPQSFLDLLESKCMGRTALERLRASPAYAAFLKRWNTSVYFSLLYQEIAGVTPHPVPD